MGNEIFYTAYVMYIIGYFILYQNLYFWGFVFIVCLFCHIMCIREEKKYIKNNR